MIRANKFRGSQRGYFYAAYNYVVCAHLYLYFILLIKASFLLGVRYIVCIEHRIGTLISEEMSIYGDAIGYYLSDF